MVYGGSVNVKSFKYKGCPKMIDKNHQTDMQQNQLR